MSLWHGRDGEAADQIAWTRDLARDLFPDVTAPFAWSLLRTPAEEALRRALAELGAPEPAAVPLWRRDEDGRVRISAQALAGANRALCGGAWLGSVRPEPPSGVLVRLQAGGIIRRAQVRIDQVRAEVAALHARQNAWLIWVRGLGWAQADLLQVMEELEPHAREMLRAYFTLVAGLAAARTQVDDRLAEWLPNAPQSIKMGLYAGLEDLPTVKAARQLTVVAAAPTDDATRQDVLASYGHRGPGEMRPDARRWADDPAGLAYLAGQITRHTAGAAQQRRVEAESWIAGRLDSGRYQQFGAALARARDLCWAADLAWDALTMVMAAAQRWLHAASSEALSAGLISEPGDVLYLELEELKQVATGEWHRGRSAAVQEAVTRRRLAPSGAPAFTAQPAPISPGEARGPLHLATAPLPAERNEIWLAEGADPGCAPFWLGASGVITVAADAWSPGAIALRALGVPAVGGVAARAQARPGQMAMIDGDAASIVLD